MAIGSPYNDGNGSYAGHVRIYENQSGTWTQIGNDIDGEAAEDNSGYSVSLSSDGSVVAIGAPYNADNGSGHVRIYELLNNQGISDELNLNEVSIFPNPTNGVVNLNFVKNNMQKLTISDITGKLIFEKTNIKQNEQIDLSDFDSGIYIISVQTDNEIFTTKVVKE